MCQIKKLGEIDYRFNVNGPILITDSDSTQKITSELTPSLTTTIMTPLFVDRHYYQSRKGFIFVAKLIYHVINQITGNY